MALVDQTDRTAGCTDAEDGLCVQDSIQFAFRVRSMTSNPDAKSELLTQRGASMLLSPRNKAFFAWNEEE